MLSCPLALPSGQGAFWASFPKAVPLSTSVSLGTVHRDLGAPSRLFPLPPPAGVQQDCLSPKREQLAMSKSCQEKKKSDSPPPCLRLLLSPVLLAGRWLRPAARLVAGMLFAPLPEAGAVSPLAPLGPEVTVLTQERCLLINLRRDLCLSPSWHCWRQPKAGGWRRLVEVLPSPACPGRGAGRSRIPHHQV